MLRENLSKRGLAVKYKLRTAILMVTSTMYDIIRTGLERGFSDGANENVTQSSFLAILNPAVGGFYRFALHIESKSELVWLS